MSLKGKRVLVTGSNGFIGSHLINRLIKEKADIYCVDKNKQENDSVKSYELDIKNFLELKKIIEEVNPEIIFHLAAMINNSREEGIIKEIFEVNTIGTLNLLIATININYDLLIYTNTFELYGDENQAPFNEEMNPKGISPYSTSKICGEYYCKLFLEIYDKPIISFRLPIVYGPGQKGKMFIPDLMNSIIKRKEFSMTKGKQTRDFIYVDDVIEAFIMACNKKNMKGIFNLGYGKEISMKEVIETIKKNIDIDIKFDKPYKEKEIWHYYSDISKIKKELGWEPRTELKEGLRKTLEWWKNNG